MSGTNIYATFGGFPILDPVPLYEYAQREGTPTEFWGRANSFRCPRGREPGVGYVLMRRGDLFTRTVAFSPATIEGKLNPNAAQSLKVFQGSSTPALEIPSLYITRALCMTRQAYRGDDDSAYLVEVMDKRRIFQMTLTGVRGFNRHDNLSTVANTTSWSTLFSTLWSLLPSSIRGTVPSLPYTPHGYPEEVRFYGETAWDAICSALDQLACTVAYDPVADAFSFVRIGDTQSGLSDALESLDNEGRLLFDYDPISTRVANLPTAYRIFFPARQRHAGAIVYNQTPQYEARTDADTVGFGAISGTEKPVFNNLRALYHTSATPGNNSDLLARRDELVPYVRTADNSINDRLRRHFIGITTAIVPGSEISEVAWRNYSDGWITEVVRGPKSESVPACHDLASTFAPHDNSPGEASSPEYTVMLRPDALEGPDEIENDSASQTSKIIGGLAWRWNPATDGYLSIDFRVPSDNKCWIICDRQAVLFGSSHTYNGLYHGRLFGYYDPDPGGGGTDERPLYAIGDFPKILRCVLNGSSLAEVHDDAFGTGIIVPITSYGDQSTLQIGDEFLAVFAGNGKWYAWSNLGRIGRIEDSWHLGRLDGALTPGSTATVSLYSAVGSDTSNNVTGSGALVQEELPTNTYVWLRKFGSTWYVISPTRPGP